MSMTLGNVRGIPPVEVAGKVLTSTDSGTEWGDGAGGRLGPYALAVTDWNTVIENGWYYSGHVANVPVAGNWIVGIVSSGGGKVEQTTWVPDGNWEYKRFSPNNGATWSPWIQTLPISDAGLPLRLGSRCTDVPGGDWNNATQSGFYRGATAANAPPFPTYNYAMGFVTAYDGPSGHVGQLVIGLFENQVWFRRQSSGAWSAWEQLNLPLRLSAMNNTIADCNAFTENGWAVSVASTTANGPYGASAASGQWGVIRCELLNYNGNLVQTFYQYGTNNTFERRRWDATWGAWRQIDSAAGDPLKLDKQSLVGGTGLLFGNRLVVGDANYAFFVDAVGFHHWGPGGASAVDTSLYRHSAGYLRTVNFVVDNEAYVDFGNTGKKLFLGSSGDCMLYRSNPGAGVRLTTDIPMLAAGYNCRAGSTGTIRGNKFIFDWVGSAYNAYIDDTFIVAIYSSDGRNKKSVKPLTSTWETVKKLNPVSFRWRDKGIFKDDKKDHNGFIAQEVEEVIPSGVSKDPADETGEQPMSLNLNSIVANLTKALQEAMERIEALEARG